MAIDGYSPHEHRPLAAYAGLSAGFGTGLAGILLTGGPGEADEEPRGQGWRVAVGELVNP